MRAALEHALSVFADRTVAVCEDGSSLTYEELGVRARKIARQLPARKSLVFIQGGNSIQFLAAYVGALVGGHLVHVSEPNRAARLASLVETFSPDAIVRCSDHETSIEIHPRSDRLIHDDLALLFATSGTTGTSRMVKITRDNILSNTKSIIEYLGLTSEDRALTLLRPSYPYGLSIINTHLLSGGSLVLTNLSASDPALWRLAAEQRITNFSGVPYTFDLITDSIDVLHQLSALRFVTQAGGKLHRDKVKKFARLGEKQGWKFFVMYGQTEASPRVAYVPPELLLENPDSIGVAIPRGRLEIVDDSGVAIEGNGVTGELVYYGPNVMAGYAEHEGDLACAEPLGRLKTGDLAYRKSNGLCVVVGRKSRFVKPMGIRVSLDAVEQVLIGAGFRTAAVAEGEHIVVFCEGENACTSLVASRLLELPANLISVRHVDDIPRLDSGKTDYLKLGLGKWMDDRLSVLAHPVQFAHDVFREVANLLVGGGQSRTVSEIFRETLHKPEVLPSDTFFTLDGDSMNYVELSLALSDVLGDLPKGWNVMSIAELEAIRESRE